MKFQGEKMKCIICGKIQHSDPHIESQWRCLVVDGMSYYVCPKHFPPDETATKAQFATAYEKVMRKIIKLRRRGL